MRPIARRERPKNTRRLAAWSVTTAVVLLSACGAESTSDATIAPLLTTVPTTVAPPPATTTPAGLPTTAVPPATPVPTPAPTTAPSTTAPPTTVAPTSAPPTTLAVLSSLTLLPDGLGTARFGADPEQVISYVAAILGRPTEDSDWVDETTAFPDCPGDEIRVVRWGDLRLLFSDESPARSGRRHLMSYVLGPTGGPPAVPAGLVTSERLGVGNTVGELRFTHPDVVLWVDEARGPSFLLDDGINGTIDADGTDFADDRRITMVMAGPRCDT